MKKNNNQNNNFNKSSVKMLIVGVVLGMVLMGVIAWNMMPSMMINVHESKLNFEDTILAINQSAAESNGWKIPVIHDLQASLVKAGHTDMTKVKVIELCHPHYAYDVLQPDEDKMISAIMPCRMSVYEDKAGNVYIAEMNTKLVSKMFGGNIAQVMRVVADEQTAMFEHIMN